MKPTPKDWKLALAMVALIAVILFAAVLSGGCVEYDEPDAYEPVSPFGKCLVICQELHAREMFAPGPAVHECAELCADELTGVCR